MNCHGVAGLPFRFTHRFAPQAQSSMSSRHGKAPRFTSFSETSCWWPLTLFVSMADSFSRSGGLISPGPEGREGAGGPQGAGDGAVPIC